MLPVDLTWKLCVHDDRMHAPKHLPFTHFGVGFVQILLTHPASPILAAVIGKK